MSGQKNVYIFTGPPGSGKGTLSNLCLKTMGWVQLSTGNLCRKHIAEQTEIGKQIDFALKSGKLVSDSLINSMVIEWFAQVLQSHDNIILDGYPRTVGQAQAFSEYVEKAYDSVNISVIRFFISDDAVITRICGRLVCQNKECQAVYSAYDKALQDPVGVEMKCDRCSCELGRRSDDSLTSIKERLDVYHKHECDLLNFYRSRGLPVKEFEVEKSLDVVFEDFKKIIGHSNP